MIGFVHPGTALGTFSTMMGSRKTVPPKMFRMVPLGDYTMSVSEKEEAREGEEKGGRTLHIFLSLNSTTRASSGVIVAHCRASMLGALVPLDDLMHWPVETYLYSYTILQDCFSSVYRNFIIRLISVLQSQIIILDIDIQEG